MNPKPFVASTTFSGPGLCIKLQARKLRFVATITSITIITIITIITTLTITTITTNITITTITTITNTRTIAYPRPERRPGGQPSACILLVLEYWDPSGPQGLGPKSQKRLRVYVRVSGLGFRAAARSKPSATLVVATVVPYLLNHLRPESPKFLRTLQGNHDKES